MQVVLCDAWSVVRLFLAVKASSPGPQIPERIMVAWMAPPVWYNDLPFGAYFPLP